MFTQRFLESLGQEICLVRYWHDATAPTVVFCPGLNMSKSGACFILPRIAKRCYERGMNAILFDYVGEGDSTGTFEDVTFESLLHSTLAVIEFVEGLGSKKIALLGNGVGNIVACYLGQRQTISAIALLLPDWHFLSDFSQTCPLGLKERDVETGYLDLDVDRLSTGSFWRAIAGIFSSSVYNPISLECLHQLSKLDPVGELLRVPKPALVLLGDDDEPLGRYDENWVEHVRIAGLSKTDCEEWASWTGWPQQWDEIIVQSSEWLNDKLTIDGGEARADKSSETAPVSAPITNRCQPGTTNRHSISFEVAGERILGVLHVPATTDKRPCVIYEHGLGGERVDSYRCGPQLGEALAAKGFYLLRYDSRGSGVSEGKFFETTWSRRFEDLSSMLQQLAEIDQIDVDQIALVGNSAGARVACYAANRIAQVRGCVLWSPQLAEIVNPAKRRGRHVVRFHRHPSGKLVAPFWGWWIGMDYHVDLKQHDFMAEFELCNRPILTLVGSQDRVTHQQLLEEIADRQPEKTLVEIDGGHQFTREGMKKAIAASTTWLANLFSGSDR